MLWQVEFTIRRVEHKNEIACVLLKLPQYLNNDTVTLWYSIYGSTIESAMARKKKKEASTRSRRTTITQVTKHCHEFVPLTNAPCPVPLYQFSGWRFFVIYQIVTFPSGGHSWSSSVLYTSFHKRAWFPLIFAA